MSTETEKEEKMFSEKLQERFNALPKALQNAITSADVEKKLRGLSETHKLHLDQWQKLENEVMLALLGFQPVENLEANIKNEVGIAEEEAKALAGDIADTIFEPIREELERELGKPADEPVAGSPQPVAPIQNTEYRIQNTVPAPPIQSPIQTSAQTIIENIPPRPVEVTVVPPAPSTPPAPAPTARSVRATLSPAYAPDSKSHERKTVDDDPYRESIA